MNSEVIFMIYAFIHFDTVYRQFEYKICLACTYDMGNIFDKYSWIEHAPLAIGTSLSEPHHMMFAFT